MNSFIFIFFKKEKLFSNTCRYYVGKRYKCDRKRHEKGRLRVLYAGAILVPFPPKSWSKNRCKNRCRKNMKIIIKGSQNGAEIDAKTHQKSMPELVSKKIKEIIKNHVSLKSEIIEIHWKNNGFWWFRRLHVRTVKVSKKHQKCDQFPSEIQWKIDTKNMLEKREPKYENSSKKWSQNGAKIHQKSFQNRCEKRDEKKEGLKPGMAECASSPNPIISKDILRSEVRRKQTKKAD